MGISGILPSQIIRNLFSSYASASPLQPQYGMHASDMHAAKVETGGYFYDDLNNLNTAVWSTSDGSNGIPFKCGWKPDHVTCSGGKMILTLDNTPFIRPLPDPPLPYTSGEFRSNALYDYGTVKASIKPSNVLGVMQGSLFICTGPWDNGNQRDEIDIEFVQGKMQTNYYTNGVGGHETLIDLGFDPSAAFHTYAIEWLPGNINWYVDGIKVHSENGSRGPLPITPGRIMANLWTGDSTLDSWLGHFTYTGPVTAEYDWIQYTPYSTPSEWSDDVKVSAVRNPSSVNSGSWITWDNNHYSRVEVRIYTVSGELVRTLIQDDPNHYSVKWDGKNMNGTTVTPGQYPYYVLAKDPKDQRMKYIGKKKGQIIALQ